MSVASSSFAFIKKAMPFLGTVLETAVPATAPFVSIGAKLLSSGLNKTVEADPGKVVSVIQEAMADPAQLATLKQIDDQFALQMKSLEIQSAEDFAQLATADTASAREMQIATRSWLPAFLAILAVGTLLFCIWLVAFHTLPSAGHDALILLLGIVTASYKDVYGYYFGSSSGSDAKTQIMASQANQASAK